MTFFRHINAPFGISPLCSFIFNELFGADEFGYYVWLSLLFVVICGVAFFASQRFEYPFMALLAMSVTAKDDFYTQVKNNVDSIPMEVNDDFENCICEIDDHVNGITSQERANEFSLYEVFDMQTARFFAFVAVLFMLDAKYVYVCTALVTTIPVFMTVRFCLNFRKMNDDYLTMKTEQVDTNVKYYVNNVHAMLDTTVQVQDETRLRETLQNAITVIISQSSQSMVCKSCVIEFVHLYLMSIFYTTLDYAGHVGKHGCVFVVALFFANTAWDYLASMRKR